MWSYRGGISRRGLLQGAIVVAGYALSASVRVSRSPSTESVTAGSLGDHTEMATATFFTPDWGQQVTAAFPVHYTMGTNRAAVLTVEWDARLFAVQDAVSGVAGGSIRNLSVRRVGPAALTIDIPPHVSEVVLRVSAVDNYPNENLADVQGTGFTLIDESGSVLEQWRDEPVGVDCAPWSIETAVNWICHEGWVVPARIAVSSIGPSAIPAGTAIRASYADVLNSPVLVDPLTREVPDQGGGEDGAGRRSLPGVVEQNVLDGMCELSLTTTDTLPAGTSLELLFEVAASDSRPRPFGEFVPRMRLVPPADPLGMRRSGRHSDFPVTGSGSQRSSYVPEPSA